MKISMFSKAAHSTWIHFPEYKMLFDCGEGCATILGINTVASIKDIFITHYHADHIAGLYNLIRLRARHGDNIPKLTIWVPETDKISKFIEFIGPHDNVKWTFYDGECYYLTPSNKTLKIWAFQTTHCFNSWGFNLIESRTRLKPEYAKLTTLTSLEIANLVRSGKEVKESFSKTLLTYTGDTPPIPDVSIFQEPEILITDCTYLDSNDNNDNYKHCTLNDALDMYYKSNAKKMIGMHLSARYDFKYILKLDGERKLSQDYIILHNPDKVMSYEV